MIDPKAIKDSQFSMKSLPGITVWMARQELISPIFKRFNQNKPIPVTGYTLNEKSVNIVNTLSSSI